MTMRRLFWIALALFVSAAASPAQIANVTTDILGAHLNYGRGCAACHSPHSGALGNGLGQARQGATSHAALWGEDASNLFGKTIASGGGLYVEVLPSSLDAGTPDAAGMLTCLTCHDGNYASAAMMKNRVYEALPPTYGIGNKIPTLFGGSAQGYINDHPVGMNAHIDCGGDTNWDCTVTSGGEVKMSGAKSSLFVANYGFFMKPGSANGKAVVMCTTCHDPHRMNLVIIASGSPSGLPPGTYASMFFLRAPYNPNDPNPATNQTAQFCRQCHADLSNEMNGSTASTVF